MGYQTTIVVLNDAAHMITEDPKFPKKLYDGINAMALRPENPIDVSIGGHVNAVQIVAQEHADVMSIIASGGNSGRVIGHGRWSNSDHTLLHNLAALHGFKLVPLKPFKSGNDKCPDCIAGTERGLCYDCGRILTKKFVCPKDYSHRR